MDREKHIFILSLKFHQEKKNSQLRTIGLHNNYFTCRWFVTIFSCSYWRNLNNYFVFQWKSGLTISSIDRDLVKWKTIKEEQQLFDQIKIKISISIVLRWKSLLHLQIPFSGKQHAIVYEKQTKKKRSLKNVILWIGTFIALEVGPSPINSINPNISAVKH